MEKVNTKTSDDTFLVLTVFSFSWHYAFEKDYI